MCVYFLCLYDQEKSLRKNYYYIRNTVLFSNFSCLYARIRVFRHALTTSFSLSPGRLIKVEKADRDYDELRYSLYFFIVILCYKASCIVER